MKNLMLGIILTNILVSCNDGTLFSDFDRDFDQNQWPRSDTRSYEFHLDHEETGTLYFDFSYVEGIVFPNVPVKVTLSGPGISSETTIYLSTSGPDGQPLGDCDGDYCDMLFPVFNKLRLKPGSYTVSVQNEFSYKYLPNVLGIGIKLKRYR